MEQTEATITREDILLLLTSYQSYIGNFHVPQLEAFLTRQI